MRRVGVLMNTTAADIEGRDRITAFLQRLKELGWTDGRNVQVDTRWASGKTGDYRRSAMELVALMPEVILANGTPAVTPLLEETRAIPIVFVSVIDSVGAGFVTSLHNQVAMGRALPFTSTAWEENGSSCSKRSLPNLAEPRSCATPRSRRGSACSGLLKLWRRL